MLLVSVSGITRAWNHCIGGWGNSCLIPIPCWGCILGGCSGVVLLLDVIGSSLAKFIYFLHACINGFSWVFLFWNYTRYMWVTFVPSWNLCSNALQWCYHLGTGISSTPPFLGESSPGNSILGEKKICVRDDSRSKVPLLLSQMLPVDHEWFPLQ